MTRTPTARPVWRNDDDGGFALATVLVTMSLLSLFVIAATSYATGTIPQSRRAQDFQASIAAAQVGVDEVLARLNTCDDYWRAPCADSPPVSAQGATFVNVPGTDGVSQGQYRWQFIGTPDNGVPVIRVRSWGRVNGVERSITVDLKKKSFLEYIYYTDRESTDPTIVAKRYPSRQLNYGGSLRDRGNGNRAIASIRFDGVLADEAVKCARYWYSTPPAAGTRLNPGESATIFYTNSTSRDVGVGATIQTLLSNGNQFNIGTRYSCDINFVGGDIIDGPLYTNDAMLLYNLPSSSGRTEPWFTNVAETYWQRTDSPAADPSGPYRSNPNGGSPHDPGGDGTVPVIATRQVNMPPDNLAIKAVAAAGGCVYVGPTRIRLDDTGSVGRMRVTSPMTNAPGPGCGTNLATEQVVNIPTNRTVYVDFVPAARTCPAGKVLGKYPVNGDVTSYDCKSGDVFLEGKLRGQLTIAAHGNFIVTDDVTYSGGRNGSDVLGLIANGFVDIYHPVRCATTPAAGFACTDFDNITGSDGVNDSVEVNAAILSTAHSFTVQNYDKGEKLGTLTVFGGIYQRYRGPVGTGGDSAAGSGYLKEYKYDRRLVFTPPPNFIEPAQAPWTVTGFTED